jgi:Cu2+-exporting ATPase
MNTLVSLGALASFGMSTAAVLMPALGWPTFFEEPVMLLAFVLLGRAVEERAKLRATSDMSALLNLLPATARLIPGVGRDGDRGTGEQVSGNGTRDGSEKGKVLGPDVAVTGVAVAADDSYYRTVPNHKP